MIKFKVGPFFFYISRTRMKRRSHTDILRRNKRNVINGIKATRYADNGGCCDLCGKHYKLDNLYAHHILRASEYPQYVTDPNNILLACEKCHQEIHEKEREQRKEAVAL